MDVSFILNKYYMILAKMQLWNLIFMKFLEKLTNKRNKYMF